MLLVGVLLDVALGGGYCTATMALRSKKGPAG
jgi:hypothetical protein